MTRTLEDLIALGDPAELLLEVDRLVAGRDWDALVTLRDRCEEAVEVGRQLWPVAQFAEYRLALEAPGPRAAQVCRTGAGRFALGPLPEVTASTHSWDELADHLDERWVAATVAQERVLRGEDLRGDARAHPEELDLPLVLAGFESDYPLPTYRSHELLEGGPAPVADGSGAVDAPPGPPADIPDVERALAAVGATWAHHSNGACHVAVVRGGAGGAAAALVEGEVAMTEIEAADAMARLAWTAASGGAYGRRAGMAAGRSAAFWVLRAALGLAPDADVSAITGGIGSLRWFALSGAEGDRGWSLRLGLESADGWSAAIDAFDRLRDDDERTEGDDRG